MLLLAVAAAEEQAAPLFMPNWAFALTAFIIFLFIGIVAWSFRDVANRHAHKVRPGDAHRGAGEHAGH
jgi:hypothetical protein